MSKHTPGPWVIVGHAKDPNICTPDGWWIVNQVCSGVYDDDNSGESNAHLIAAAPGMLEALEESTTALEATARFCVQDSHEHSRLMKQVRHNRQVIAKAKGETS